MYINKRNTMPTHLFIFKSIWSYYLLYLNKYRLLVYEQLQIFPEFTDVESGKNKNTERISSVTLLLKKTIKLVIT